MLTMLNGITDGLPQLRELDISDTGIGDIDLGLLACDCPQLRCDSDSDYISALEPL